MHLAFVFMAVSSTCLRTRKDKKDYSDSKIKRYIAGSYWTSTDAEKAWCEKVAGSS
jgi:hypothetical protein